MKLLILSFFTLIITSCDAQTNEKISIEYYADTRGTHISLITNSVEKIYKTNDTKTEVKLSEHQWDKIKELVYEIDINAIQNLKTPSEGSHTDRALIATLSITIGSKTYESVNFDHGNPPIELKKLIDRLFEIVQ